ncbi:hypothetical protein ACFYUV_49080 [Nonomuraea sp. NPDC003560]|uniref:hypothetical protein n=1 Tax=Nonomuraea sp. NPDC003560 TaxID=3364341 RepID=UPI00367F4F6F
MTDLLPQALRDALHQAADVLRGVDDAARRADDALQHVVNVFTVPSFLMNTDFDRLGGSAHGLGSSGPFAFPPLNQAISGYGLFAGARDTWNGGVKLGTGLGGGNGEQVLDGAATAATGLAGVYSATLGLLDVTTPAGALVGAALAGYGVGTTAIKGIEAATGHDVAHDLGDLLFRAVHGSAEEAAFTLPSDVAPPLHALPGLAGPATEHRHHPSAPLTPHGIVEFQGGWWYEPGSAWHAISSTPVPGAITHTEGGYRDAAGAWHQVSASDPPGTAGSGWRGPEGTWHPIGPDGHTIAGAQSVVNLDWTQDAAGSWHPVPPAAPISPDAGGGTPGVELNAAWFLGHDGAWHPLPVHDGTAGDGGQTGTAELVSAAYQSPDGGWHPLPGSQPETAAAASGDTGHAHGGPDAAQQAQAGASQEHDEPAQAAAVQPDGGVPATGEPAAPGGDGGSESAAGHLSGF